MGSGSETGRELSARVELHSSMHAMATAGYTVNSVTDISPTLATVRTALMHPSPVPSHEETGTVLPGKTVIVTSPSASALALRMDSEAILMVGDTDEQTCSGREMGPSPVTEPVKNSRPWLSARKPNQ